MSARPEHREMCFASHDDPTLFVSSNFAECEVNCTEPIGHLGEHIARDLVGTIIVRWPNELSQQSPPKPENTLPEWPEKPTDEWTTREKLRGIPYGLVVVLAAVFAAIFWHVTHLPADEPPLVARCRATISVTILADGAAYSPDGNNPRDLACFNDWLTAAGYRRDLGK